MRAAFWLWCAFLLAAAPLGARAQETDANASPAVAEAPGGDGAAADEPGEEAKEQAREHFKMGVSFYREDNYAAALVEFKRAYEIAPHYKLKFNLGQTALDLGDYPYAIDNLTAYLREGGDDVPAERRKLVEYMIKELEGRLAMVTITSNQEGAEVYVDDRLIGRTPFAQEVPIGAGRRRVVAIKDGFVTVERRVDLAARDRVKLALDFRAQPKAKRVVVTKVVNEGPSLSLWMGVGTGVLAAGTATLAILTGIAKQEFDAEMERATTPERIATFKENAETRALLTDIALGVTGAAAIATLVVVVLEINEDDDNPIDAAKRTAIAPNLAISPNGAHLSIGGRF